MRTHGSDPTAFNRQVAPEYPAVETREPLASGMVHNPPLGQRNAPSHAATRCCPICTSAMASAFAHKVLCKYDAEYLYCRSCGFLSATPADWLDEAYVDAISCLDTGLVARNLHLSRRLAVLLALAFDPKARYVDVGGGTGLFARLMRDQGFDFYWQDDLCRNVHAVGFEDRPELGPAAAVTAFEVLEHTRDPYAFLREALARNQAQAIIFTTELFDGEPPAPGQWWYYAFESGQHISFMQPRTLAFIARELNMTFQSRRGLHILSRRPVPRHALALTVGRPRDWALAWVRRQLRSRTQSDLELLRARILAGHGVSGRLRG